MTTNCPHCGKPINDGSRAEELLHLLRIPTHRKYKSGKVDRRQVYLAANSSEWFITYSGDLPAYVPFSREDIDVLLRRGAIERDVPEFDTAFVAKD